MIGLSAISRVVGQNLFPIITCGLIIFMAVDGARDRELLYQQRERQMILLLEASEEDKKQAQEQKERLENLKVRTENLVDALENPDNLCFGPADTDRLRSLWD